MHTDTQTHTQPMNSQTYIDKYTQTVDTKKYSNNTLTRWWQTVIWPQLCVDQMNGVMWGVKRKSGSEACDSLARLFEMTVSEGPRSRWLCLEGEPFLQHKYTKQNTSLTVVFTDCMWGGGCLWVCVCVCLSLFNERARKMNWPGSEKTALEWQARRSSRIRLKTDPCREHHTLTDTHTHTHNNTTSSHTLMIYIYIYSTM